MASASCRTSHAKAKSWVSRPPFGSCAQLWDGRNKAGPPPNGPSVRLELAPGESVAAFGRRAFECSAPRHSSSSALECTRKCRTKLLCDDDKLCMWFGSGGGGVGAGGKGRVRVRFRTRFFTFGSFPLPFYRAFVYIFTSHAYPHPHCIHFHITSTPHQIRITSTYPNHITSQGIRSD